VSQKAAKELTQSRHYLAVRNEPKKHSMTVNVQDNLLGPTVFTEIMVDSIPAKALVDTGSPATIISLNFVLDVFAQQRDKTQSPEQWMQHTWKKFSTPEVSLKNYGGDPLNIVSQTQLTLSRSSHSTVATVLVQKGAPHDLLLGTDVQHKLGFALVAATTDSTMDLLTGKEYGLSRGALVPPTPPDLTSGSDRVCPSSGEEATYQAPGDSSSAGGPADKSLE